MPRSLRDESVRSREVLRRLANLWKLRAIAIPCLAWRVQFQSMYWERIVEMVDHEPDRFSVRCVAANL